MLGQIKVLALVWGHEEMRGTGGEESMERDGRRDGRYVAEGKIMEYSCRKSRAWGRRQSLRLTGK